MADCRLSSSLVFAHSTIERSQEDWEPLAAHLADVGRIAAGFAEPLGWRTAARTAGLLHDVGKLSPEFQAYIKRPRQPGQTGPDHATAGAQLAVERYGPHLGRMIAYAVAGHHAGLADGTELDRRLQKTDLGDVAGWEMQTGPLPSPGELAPTRRPDATPHAGFGKAFLTRMLFSCLAPSRGRN